MTKIVSSPNCGNSPKMEFLKEFNIAFAKGNIKFLIENVTEDVVWEMVGDKTIEGKNEYSKTITKMKDEKVSEFVIEKIVTHGKVGAVNGIVRMKNGKNYAFSDFYEFKNTKSTDLRTITSYVIKI